MGDPSGIGPEIIIKALQSPDIAHICAPLVIGDRLALERALYTCGSTLKINEVATAVDARYVDGNVIPLLVLSHLTDSDIRYGAPSVAAGDAVYRYICSAAHLCLENHVAAMATAPICKEAMHQAGHDYPGHTELLAELCRTDDFVMMLAGDVLRVSLVTIHEALADVPHLVTFEQVLKTIRITAAGIARLTGKAMPKLAVCALNPHCGEGGKFGSHENVIIAPAVEAARMEGLDVSGPHSADTLFHFARQGCYDGVVAMYHDQGLIPLKMLHFDDAVNITLGLPIIRTSVDHGTAYNLAGSGTASESSLLAAIRMAAAMAQ
ncbi:MAG: 4-hydroxythreonine-4-phosphate dehydrogenase PdxA [Desulfuromonadaceae bacterium]|nr:4-hydroxythreonine-4-phosphate dehydrogenase PdxA [Desulfuromonadaceae bacterium]MDD2848606.1 4-hydroxythreonine-4-phosphate dehydrogenase PdxA [Desulfuromonadaceae bacterium]